MRLQRYLKSLLVVFLLPLSLHALNPDTTEWKLKISVEIANIRHEPDAESPVVSTASKGTILDSYEKSGEWFRVVIGSDEKGFSVIGYIHSRDIIIIKEKIVKDPDFWEEEPEFFKGIGLRVKLTGGVDFFNAGDIGKGTKGSFDSTSDFLSSEGYTLDKRREPFHSAYDVSGDVILYVTPKLGIGLGVGYIFAHNTNLIIISGGNIASFREISSCPEIAAVPIRLGLFFTLPIHRLFSISFNSGTSLFLTRYSYSLSTGWKDQKNIFQTATARNLGFHGGIELEVNISRRAIFFIEGQGRYAKISNFKGEEIVSEWGVTQSYIGYVHSKENGTLYYLEKGKYSYLAIREQEPSGFETVRKATFDLTGFSLRVGLIVLF